MEVALLADPCFQQRISEDLKAFRYGPHVYIVAALPKHRSHFMETNIDGCNTYLSSCVAGLVRTTGEIRATASGMENHVETGVPYIL